MDISDVINIFIVILIFTMIILFITYLLSPTKKSNSINANNAKELIKQNHFDYIIDIRNNKDWNNGHYPGAIHIPFDVFYKQIINYKKDSNFLIYSKNGEFARVVVLFMKKNGFKNVKYLNTNYTSL